MRRFRFLPALLLAFALTIGVSALSFSFAAGPEPATYRDGDGAEHTLKADDVIVCGGVEPCADDALRYAACAPEFHLLGDADNLFDPAVVKAAEALQEAYASYEQDDEDE